ncbi:MAG: Gldg family protein [Clostridia bacterium]|nr:Gldg family protein [Clostridia bacterium]
MRNNKDPERSRSRLARRSTSLALTAGVVVAVLLLNVLFSALASSNLWFVDLTTYQRSTYATDAVTGERVKVPVDYEMYTLSQGAIDLLDTSLAEVIAERQQKGEEEVKVELIFCDDPDNLMSNTASRYVYITALSLEKQFPDIISVKCIDVYKNPSAVQKYKTNSFATVYASNIIVSSGSEYRRLSLNSFFTFSDSTSTEPWAYNGEKTFLSAILAVIKAEAPIACLLTNHGESGYSDAFLSLLEDAGYEVMTDFDLLNDEIPEDCRLMVCVAPQTDFAGYLEVNAGEAAISEISKLDAFLDDENSLMVFFDADTPILPNFEEYLEKWGIAICREIDEAGDSINHMLKDTEAGLTADGKTIVADYVSTGLAASVLSDMQSLAYPSKVVFRNSTALKYSDYYSPTYVVADETTGVEEAFTYASYGMDGTYRSAYDIFLAQDTTRSYVGEDILPKDDSIDSAQKLMIMSNETSSEPGDRNGYTTVSHYSYVLACASTEFLCDELLMSNSYGNTDMISSVLRALGSDSMAARIDQYLKPFHVTDVTEGYVVQSQKTGYTAVLMILPAVIFFGVGVVVIVRRKYA